MIDDKEMRKLMLKFIQNECSAEEITHIINYVKNVKGTDGLPSFEEVLSLMDGLPESKPEKAEALYAQIQGKAKRQPTFRAKSKIWKYAAVAAIAVLVAITFYFQGANNEEMDNTPVIVANDIEIGTDKATLTLENGERITLNKGQAYKTDHANSDGKALTYEEKSVREIAYNYLTIPRGGQFQLTLADGSRVWLNSETQLKYPVAFVKGEAREVELIYGEAYFEVSPSTEHDGARFRVYHHQQEVEVLGTQFNIKAYQDEAFVYTTLVEGKVSIYALDKNRVLAPGEQSVMDGKSISIFQVNIHNETSWKDGVFSFEGKSLKDIMKVLSRWYDMEVEFADPQLEEIRFIGVLGKDQNIEAILQTIQNTGFIKNYEIYEKTVILK